MQGLVEPSQVGHRLVMLFDEMAQQVTGSCGRQAHQRGAVKALASDGLLCIQPRQVVHQVGGIRLQRGCTRQGAAEARKMLRQQWHYLLA